MTWISHDDHIDILEAENGRQKERIHELESALLRVLAWALTFRELYPGDAGVDDILSVIARVFNERVDAEIDNKLAEKKGV